MHGFSLRLLTLGLVVTGLGCSSEPGTTPETVAPDADAGAGASTAEAGTTTTTGTSLDEARAFRTQVAKAVCTTLDRCCASADRAAYFTQFREKPYELSAAPSAIDCERVLGETLGKLHDKWLPSLERGAIAFDRTKAAACVASVTSATCGASLATTLYGSDCWGPRGKVFLKKVSLGEACENIGDGTYYGECDPALGFCGNVSKRCEPWKTTGQDCSAIGTWAFCAPGLNCDNATPSRPGKCSAAPITVAIGASCTALSGPTTLCNEDAFCNYDTGKCEAKKADGVACKYDDECTTSHPFTCSPFGAGSCGQNSYCAGVTR